MKKILFLLILCSLSGCSGTLRQDSAARHESDQKQLGSAPLRQDSALRHESDEKQLLTEAEFMARVARSATLIYDGLRAINDAAQNYALDHDGNLPSGSFDINRSLLLDGGYLQSWPVIPPFAFTEPVQADFRYAGEYDDMDGLGALDAVIYAQDLKIEVCQEFIGRYASDGLKAMIHDHEAAGNKYPGEVFGRHMKIYAISWSKAAWPDHCDIEWVMQYK